MKLCVHCDAGWCDGGGDDLMLYVTLVFQHTTRTFHALDGSLEKTDSGFWINSFDYTGMSHITPHVPEINDTIRMRCSDELPFCGFPWFLPVKFLIK